MPPLIEKLRSPEPSVRIEAAEELAVLGPAAKNAVPSLMDLLDDEDANVRASAAIALGRIGPDAKEAVGKLTGLLEDSSELIRWAVLVRSRRNRPRSGFGSSRHSPQTSR